MRAHVVITGTGRCGTTFLVQLLTRLGLDTGYNANSVVSGIYPNARAGLERDVRHDNCPFIVKWPAFCYFADEILRREDLVIEHIFIPMRDLDAAAESRRYVHRSALEKWSRLRRAWYRFWPWVIPGGLCRTTSCLPGEQEAVLLRQIYKLMLAVSNASVPVTFMRYPRIVNDCGYLYEKLQPVLNDIPWDTFSEAFLTTVRPELVHCHSPDDTAF